MTERHDNDLRREGGVPAPDDAASAEPTQAIPSAGHPGAADQPGAAGPAPRSAAQTAAAVTKRRNRTIVIASVTVAALVLGACGVALGLNALSPVVEQSGAPAGMPSDKPAPPEPPQDKQAQEQKPAAAGPDDAVKAARSHTVICIDPGHSAQPDSTPIPIGPGASQTRPVEPGGTRGTTTGVPEYQVCLDVGLKLRDKLRADGYQVVMVRETNEGSIGSDVRAKVANDANAALFVRLHCDGAGSPAANGFMTLIPASNSWTAPIYASSKQAGEIMHRSILGKLGVPDRGLIERGDLAGFNWCKVPSVLFEMGCMTNPDEDRRLVSPEYQDLLAQAIAQACTDYLDATNPAR